MRYLDWKEVKVNVSDVLLDYDNPRVFINHPSQENLLKFLVEEDGVIDLANQIHLNQGLPLAEKPVVTLEDGKLIVLEGNRRFSACKILLNPHLLSEKEAKMVPKIDYKLKTYLENFPVVQVPDRDSAEAFITMRHSGDKNVKKWSTIASTKRFVTRFIKGESISHIARVLDEKTSDVRKGIRFYFFLEYITNEIEWSEEEKIRLEIYKMETTKLDRFLPFSKKAKDILKIDFLANHSIKTDLPEIVFKEALKNIISRIYITNEIDTRSKMEDVFNSHIVNLCNLSQRSDGTLNEKFIRADSPTINSESHAIITDNIKADEENGSSDLEMKNEQISLFEVSNQSRSKSSNDSENHSDISNYNLKESTLFPEKQSNSSEHRDLSSHNSSFPKIPKDKEKYDRLLNAYPLKHYYKKNNRINTLFKELKNSKYKENKMASMYLIRSLLETYTHEYIDLFQSEKTRDKKIKGVAKDRNKRQQKLRELLYNNIKSHLKSFYPEFAEEIELIDITFTENNNTAVTKIINFYIHAQTQVPDYHELLDSWKKISSILRCLDKILFEESEKTL